MSTSFPGKFEPEFLAQARTSNFCARYYELCSQHPLRNCESIPKMATKDVIREAKGRIELSKPSGGLGRIISVEGLPEGSSLYFIIQYRTVVETEFSMLFRNRHVNSTFAILCNEATRNQGADDPLYPRPRFYSIEELLEIFESLQAMFVSLVRPVN